jgi:microcystin-dependent protein
MSNFIYNGYSFSDSLLKKWMLQNIFPTVSGETQEMNLQLLDYQGDGFELITQNVSGSSSNFVFRNIISNVETVLFTYNTTTNNFVFSKPINLGNNQINNVGNPTVGTDAVNLSTLNTSIGGLGPGTVTSIAFTQGTGVVITGGPIISSGTINISLSANLSNLSNLSTQGLVNSIGSNAFNTITQGTSLQTLAGNFTWVNRIIGPSSSTDKALVLWNGITGTVIASSTMFIDSSGNLNLNGSLIKNSGNPDGTSSTLVTEQYVTSAISAVASGAPIGAMIMWASETLPVGSGTWFECNGTTVSRTTYAALFAVIGVAWGSGDGSTTFNLPDSRGMFPRGWNHGKVTGNFDPNAATRVLSATGGLTGDHVGTQQADAFETHQHTYTLVGGSTSVSGIGSTNVLPTGNSSSPNGGATGGSETRPSNFGVMFIIKAL